MGVLAEGRDLDCSGGGGGLSKGGLPRGTPKNRKDLEGGPHGAPASPAGCVSGCPSAPVPPLPWL